MARPSRFQSAAVCYRRNGEALEIVMITSRDTRRWVLPKGWPKRGLDAAGTALEEAWEEAGVIAEDGKRKKLGSYRYEKRLEGGIPIPTLVDVYAFPVKRLEEDFPEKGQRDVHWMTLAEASRAVDEPGLRDLLAAVTPANLP